MLYLKIIFLKIDYFKKFLSHQNLFLINEKENVSNRWN